MLCLTSLRYALQKLVKYTDDVMPRYWTCDKAEYPVGLSQEWDQSAITPIRLAKFSGLKEYKVYLPQHFEPYLRHVRTFSEVVEIWSTAACSISSSKVDARESSRLLMSEI